MTAFKARAIEQPCSFCGQIKSLIVGDHDRICGGIDPECVLEGYAVCCDFSQGGCGATGGYRRTVAEAIKMWNRRATDEKT